MGERIAQAIRLIREGSWFEGVLIIILMIIGISYFIEWWYTGRWESKGKCSFCRGTGTILRGKSQVAICGQCKGLGKPKTYGKSYTEKPT